MMNSRYKSVWWRICSRVCLLAALYYAFTLILIFLAGGEWTYLFSVNNPKKRALAAFLALAAWLITRDGRLFRPLNEWKKPLGQLLLLAASLSLSFMIGEVGLRILLDRNQGDNSLEKLAQLREGEHIDLRSFHPLAAIVQLSPNKRLTYELLPNLDMEFGHRTLKTNSAGQRDSRERDPQKPEHSFRVVGIGDSGMFGWGVNQDENYLSELERILQQRDDSLSYEVINLAVPGYNTFQEVEMLRTHGLAYQPDIVVVGWCDNDFNTPFFLAQPCDFWRRDVSFLYHLFFNRAEFQRLIRPSVGRASEVDEEFVDPVVLEYTGIEGMAKSLIELRELGEEHKFNLLLIGPMNRHIVQLCEEHDIPYVNLWDEIGRDEYPRDYGVHFMHPSAEGHRVLGETLETVLTRKGWLP